jgi:hypothetical protein
MALAVLNFPLAALSTCGLDILRGAARDARLFISPPNELTYRQHVPGSLLVDDEFVADALRQLAIDACGRASHALGAGRQLILERGSRSAVHHASRDSCDGKREWEYNVGETHRVGSLVCVEGE